MPLFNVVQPCVVNGLHYVRPTPQPIEVDDEQAAGLVADGKLEPYPKRRPVSDAYVRTDEDKRLGAGLVDLAFGSSVAAAGAEALAETLTTDGDEPPSGPPPARRTRKPRAEG